MTCSSSTSRPRMFFHLLTSWLLKRRNSHIPNSRFNRCYWACRLRVTSQLRLDDTVTIGLRQGYGRLTQRLGEKTYLREKIRADDKRGRPVLCALFGVLRVRGVYVGGGGLSHTQGLYSGVFFTLFVDRFAFLVSFCFSVIHFSIC